MVLEATVEVPPLQVALSLSSSPELTEAQVDTALSHLLELEVELDLLGSSYNADMMSDQMEALWS
jgi:hypothetical protein